MSDHREAIKDLRTPKNSALYTLVDQVCADLLELHDRTGISLDNWDSARTLVEKRAKIKIKENHA